MKHGCRYLRGTSNLGLCYRRDNNASPNEQLINAMVGYPDASHAGDLQDRRSRAGWLIKMASSLIDWRCFMQNFVAMSSTEAELGSATDCVCQVLSFRMMFESIGYKQAGPTIIREDNTATIAISRNAMLQSKVKHMH